MSRRSTHDTRRALGITLLAFVVVLLIGPSVADAAYNCCGPRAGDVYRSLAVPMGSEPRAASDTVSPPTRQRSAVRIDSLRAIAKCWRFLHAPRSNITFADVQRAVACPDSVTAATYLVQYGPMYRYGEDGQVHAMIAVGDTMTMATATIHGRLFVYPKGLVPYRADLVSPSPVPGNPTGVSDGTPELPRTYLDAMLDSARATDTLTRRVMRQDASGAWVQEVDSVTGALVCDKAMVRIVCPS